MAEPSIFVHIVTFNSAAFIEKCLAAVLAQEYRGQVTVAVSDNASSDGSVDLIQQRFAGKAALHRNAQNLGFCAAHNWGAKRFLEKRYDYLLILNPDLVLARSALQLLIDAAESDHCCGLATPKLLRADNELRPVEPAVLDAAGMILTNNLRHLDRGSQEPDVGQYEVQETLFGGTGACLLLKRACVESCLVQSPYEQDLERVFPELGPGRTDRVPLFDEAFFAFREDADLCWRAGLFGWKCLFVPAAHGFHRRSVLPENRATLPAEINRHSVRNRFLLQINNYSLARMPGAFVSGVIIRNVVVLLGVLLWEQSSLRACSDLLRLWRRAWARRRIIFERASTKISA
ncbi:MAG: glycosyltransferase family 2 protein [Oligoflexia bacterium]|nr:glycosyltransferase family 2 protein [Oligoflexia bacterium]